MRKRFCLVFLSLLMVFFVVSPTSAYADSEDSLYLGGMPAGFSIYTRGANVVGLTDVITEKGMVSPSKDAGILIGDVILSIDEIEVNNANDVSNCLVDGKTKSLIIKRMGEIINVDIAPALDISKSYKLGVFIRDNVSGIGTITYIKGNRFGSLGHPVVNEDGQTLEIIGGEIFACDITGYKKGERGVPGELHGVFTKLKSAGHIQLNTIYGVFGNISENNFNLNNLEKIEKGTAEIGTASIYTTIENSAPLEYAISIVKIDSLSNTKNFVIKINDKRLIDSTGGIVQGMSGSPIVQNGKLVGAVTHVFINDPTRGFGISIDNMLKN